MLAAVCNGQENLVAKCNALREEGVSAYHWCGSYRLPMQTITGDVQVQFIVRGC